ncbi:MAG TPA: family 78 glycoside hydrolase catalytic domain, partial [Acidimicrobiales bacterium]|nr:family 78 glycoside hydrolase catalytic domain [Acidimicrobiales bacterium]
PADPGEESYTYLRRTWSLPPGRIVSGAAFVAAAHRFELWANGRRLAAGPSFCFPDEQYVQAVDLSAALSPGSANVVGVLHHWYGPGRGRPASFPGLLLQVVVRFADGRTAVLGTDSRWRTASAEWLPAPQRNNDSGDFVEWVDLRRHPDGWSRPGFDDAGWEAATVLGPVGTAPFTALYAQRTGIVERRVEPVSVRTLAGGSVVADFGRVYAGRPAVTFHRGTAGHSVPMHVGYLLDPGGEVSTTHGIQATDLSFSAVQRDGAATFEPYWYLGFRYLQVDDPGEPFGDGQVALVARHAAMPDVAPATFSSSSPELDAVWRLCAHSALYCSQEQFVDTPTREKGQFLWDAANESETVMRAFGDQNLTWQGLRDMARAQARYWPTGQVNEVYPNDDGPQDYPTFTARYPEWVWRYYLSTGDRETVVGLLPVLQRLSGYLVRTQDPSTGLVSGLALPNNGDDQYGYDGDTVADTTMNVLA